MDSKAHFGFTYTVETIKDGKVIDREVVKNLIPIEGLNHIGDVALNGATQITTWYVGLFEGAYTPTPSDVMATFPTAATECTAYTGDRKALDLAAFSGGAADNQANRAEFVGTTDGKLVQGGFVSSSPTKGATTGVLISAVRFPSPKTLDNGTTLRVTAAFNSASV